MLPAFETTETITPKIPWIQHSAQTYNLIVYVCQGLNDWSVELLLLNCLFSIIDDKTYFEGNVEKKKSKIVVSIF